jgi:lysophospholipase L1-like esterase
MHPSIRPIVEKFTAGTPVTVIAFGDSITAGSQVDPARDESIVYHKQWHDRLAQRYPKLALTIVNCGVPGHKIGDGHNRVQAEVIERKPDGVIVAFGINDCWDGPERADEFERELERLVQRVRAGCEAAIILMTTNMLNFRASEQAMKLAWFAEKTAQAQNAGWTDDYMQRVRNIAKRLDLPLADGYAKWQAARAAGVDTDALLANLANHPNRQGHALLADALDEVFAD